MGAIDYSQCCKWAVGTLVSSLAPVLQPWAACLSPTPMPEPLPTVAAHPRRSPFTRSWLNTWRPSSSEHAVLIGSYPHTSRRSCAPTLSVVFWPMGSCGYGVKTALTSVWWRFPVSDARSVPVAWDGGWWTPEIRYRLAWDGKLVSAVLAVFRAVYGWYRRQAKEQGHADGRCGSAFT